MKSYQPFFPGIENIDHYLAQAFEFAELNTPERRAVFLSNAVHESAGFTRMEENLNYRPQRLAVVWPKHFADKKTKQPNALAYQVAGDPQALAEIVYGGRFGNGPKGSGDGYKYRGRGAFQLTFKGNYARASKRLNLGTLLVDQPDLVATPEYALMTAAAFWVEHPKLQTMADMITKNPESSAVWQHHARGVINPAVLGMTEIKKLFDKFRF